MSEAARHLSRFLVIGGASVAIDAGSYAALLHFGIPAAPAKGLSYILGTLFGFVGNKLWTFESARRSASEPLTYALLYAVTLGVNIGVNHGILSWLGEGAKTPAFFAATGTTTVLNFLGMRFITFRKGIEERRQAAK